LVGEPAYETGALLRNQLSRVFDASHPARVMARRVDQLADELNLDRERIRSWGLAQAVLSTWWNVEDFGSMREFGIATLACAELLAAL
jgi:streptomycin 6-kinase